ncbi:MAG: DUF1028 domain-containing protein [Verrucomicrobia bacterium]|nr:DUF1028 domain-containing protein [Verrucomicrobiota bacterium]
MKAGWHCSLALAFVISAAAAETPVVGTYSIVAFDPATGDLGVAVQSKFFGVGSVVPWARARVGAIATQSAANTTYGPRGLELLASSKGAAEVAKLLTASDEQRDIRQLGVVDARGNSASFTGAKCNAWAGHIEGKNFCVQGNILVGEEVVRAMAAAYLAAQKTEGSELADWLMAALQAAEQAGGDKRGRQSAALLVVRERGGYMGLNDRYVDLRVEDNPQPVEELARLLDKHKQFDAAAHRQRPTAASPPLTSLASTEPPVQTQGFTRMVALATLGFLVVAGLMVLIRWWRSKGGGSQS